MAAKEELLNLLNNGNIIEFNELLKQSNNVDISETDFSGSVLENVEFMNCDLSSSSFSDSHLTEVKFINCDLTSADFNRANLIECNFTESILNGTDFSYSTINYCHFTDTDLAGSIFNAADLTNSDLTMSDNLSAVRFDEETIWPDSENLPDDFDTSYISDLSSLQEDDDYTVSDY